MVNQLIIIIQCLLLLPISDSYRIPLKRLKRQSSLSISSNIGRPLSGGALLCSNPPQPRDQQQKSIKQYLCNLQDYVYIGAIHVGTPPQMLYLTFDTGSADTWLVVDECKTRACSDDGLGGVAQRFMVGKSTSYQGFRKERFEFEYSFGGIIKGYAAQDTFCLAGLSGATCLPKFDFLAGDNVDWNNRFIDGLAGLSYSSDADLKGKQSLLDRLSANGVLKEKLFSVWLNRDTSSDQDGGEITFGYVNSTRYIGAIDYYPVIEKRLWKIRLHDAQIWDTTVTSDATLAPNSKRRSLRPLDPNKNCPTGSCEAIFDTGTSFIVGPNNATGKLIDDWSRRGWVYQKLDTGKWVLRNCSILYRLPNLVFQFGSAESKDRKEYVLTPRDYTFVEDPEFDDKCDLKLAMDTDTDDSDYWILGSAFMGKFYTVFDFGMDRIGLGVARHG